MNTQENLQNIKLIEFRNAIYQGGFNLGRKEGKGILITDDSQIYIANWKNDFMNDKALIWIDEKTYVIGQFNRGYMDGEFIYRNEKGAFYASFKQNKIVGQLVYMDKKQNKARILEFKNQKYRLINEIITIGMNENEILFKALGYKVILPTISQFMKKQMFQDKTYKATNTNLGQYYIQYNKGDTVQRLAIIISKQELISYGTFVDMKLEGIGCKYEGKIKYQGQFKNGLLNGYGIKYQILQNKYIAGLFINGNIKQVDDTNSQELNQPNLYEIKKNIHIQSIYFYNSFVRTKTLLKYRGYQETLIRSKIQILEEQPLQVKKIKSIYSDQKTNEINSPIRLKSQKSYGFKQIQTKSQNRLNYQDEQSKSSKITNIDPNPNQRLLSIRKKIEDQKVNLYESIKKTKNIVEQSPDTYRSQLIKKSSIKQRGIYNQDYQDIDSLMRQKKKDKWNGV